METSPPRKREKTKKKASHWSSSRCSGGRQDNDNDATKNLCPHCKKHARRKFHPYTEPEKYFWNPAYKGYRFRSICDALEIPFKPRSKFTPELGGYLITSNSDPE